MPDNNAYIRMVGHFDKPIPEFFEEIWMLVAVHGNEAAFDMALLDGEFGRKYYDKRGSTGINAWYIGKTHADENKFNRGLIIEYEDNDHYWHKLVMHHSSDDNKYRIALPLVPTLEGPFDSGVE
jgi:hypothetical protein